MKLMHKLEVLLLIISGLTMILNYKGYLIISCILFFITIITAASAGIVVGLERRDNKEY